MVSPSSLFPQFVCVHKLPLGYESMQMIRKGQMQGVVKGDITGQVTFIANLFGVAV